MKKTLFFLFALFATPIVADVAQVNIWKAHPGRTADMYQSAMTAKAIHEKLGATVTISTDQNMNMYYVTIFNNWEDWGKFSAQMAGSAEWDEYWSAAMVNPAAELTDTLHVNNPNPAEVRPVAMIYMWDVDRGKTEQFVAQATEAIPIHNALGASASINIDELGDVHYEMTFASWEAWGKFAAAIQQSDDWAAFQAKYPEQIATLTDVLRLNVMPDQ